MKRKRKRVVEVSDDVPHSEQPFEKMDADNVFTDSESELDEPLSSRDLNKSDQVQPVVVERGFPENATLSLGSSRHPVDESERCVDEGYGADNCSENTNFVVCNCLVVVG